MPVALASSDGPDGSAPTARRTDRFFALASDVDDPTLGAGCLREVDTDHVLPGTVESFPR